MWTKHFYLISLRGPVRRCGCTCAVPRKVKYDGVTILDVFVIQEVFLECFDDGKTRRHPVREPRNILSWNTEFVCQEVFEVLNVIVTPEQARNIFRCILVNPDDQGKYARFIIAPPPLVRIAFFEGRLALGPGMCGILEGSHNSRRYSRFFR